LQTQEETPTKGQPAEAKKKKTTHGEDQHTLNRLRTQLKEAKNVIIKLREKYRQARLMLKERLDDCEPTIDKVRAMVRRTLPLHK
jgi:hypothetical protein